MKIIFYNAYFYAQTLYPNNALNKKIIFQQRGKKNELFKNMPSFIIF